MSAVSDFVDTMHKNGIIPARPDVIAADGLIHRFRVDGDKPGSKNGWCVLFEDARGGGGAYGSWRSGLTGTWHSAGKTLTRADQKAFLQAMVRARRQRDFEQEKIHAHARRRAVELWMFAEPPFPPVHAYLSSKFICPLGIRQLNDELVIPLHDINGQLHSLQFINQEADKRFLAGGRKRGCFFMLGDIGAEILICEGLATGASIYAATKKTTLIAFDCGNLLPVSLEIRRKYPAAKITICADNDFKTTGNPGLTKAREAAKAVDGFVAIPPNGYNDFNDAAVADMAGAA